MLHNPIDILKAIRHLNSTAEVTIIEDDLDSINWIKLEGKKPTNEEILAAVDVVKANELKAIEDVENKRQSAFAKLAAIGLTEEEIAAL